MTPRGCPTGPRADRIGRPPTLDVAGRVDRMRHATARTGASESLVPKVVAKHPVICSLEPGEDWCWCYEDEITFRVDLAGAGS
jgi:hypothetical protein